ncbi:PRC-barrel domain-containing protein [Phosphitispora sp. TUW77]|uniref:PRC-barrel domain-containing protein n=1 Tax=Phosphitispora sp. TUW77 TaxID=3152361 RepID=UPI003AB5BEC2
MSESSVLMKTQSLINKPVISLQGEELGSVTRVIVNPDDGRVAGLTLSIKGWFKGEKALEFESVKSFGSYAVTIDRGSQVITLDSLPVLKKLAEECDMYNMRIITPEGRLIGTVDDFYFDTATGKIEKFILTGGTIKTVFKGRVSIPASSIENIGKDVIIAANNVTETIQKEEPGLTDNIDHWKEDIDQLKGDLEHWKDDFEKLWEKTRTKAVDISKSAGENIKAAATTGTDKGKELISKTSEVLIEKKSLLKKSQEEWVNRLHVVKNKPENPLTEDEINSILGLKAAKTIIDDAGNIIIVQDEEVFRDTIDRAQQAGKVKELLISVATKDLEEQMEAINIESQMLKEHEDL